MTGTRENVIVVGIDGSGPSHEAARWAAHEAMLRQAELKLVHVYSTQVPVVAGMLVIPPEGFDSFQQSARALADAEAAVIKSEFPQLTVRTQVENGVAFRVLKAAAENVLLTVVGSDGRGQFSKRILGSVALRMAGHAQSPVVVVRVDPIQGKAVAATLDGSVVVGLDGSADSDEALAFAFEEASLRGVDLLAVRVWDDTPFDGFARAYPLPVDREAIVLEEQQFLAQQLIGWVEKYPDVKVRRRVAIGPIAEALILECLEHRGVSEPAVLVLGCRGRGGITGLVLGSVSQAMIGHAPCPVAVVRTTKR